MPNPYPHVAQLIVMSFFDPTHHHRRSIRLKHHDYSADSIYFITICTHQRQCLFGEIIDKTMLLNDYGKIAQRCWQAIPDHFQQIKLSDFVIMPNHLHGILAIASSNHSRSPKRAFGKPIAGSLGTIIGAFKSATTKQINILREAPATPLWQRNYHEHIIRDALALQRIQNYICNNPRRWNQDQLNHDFERQSE